MPIVHQQRRYLGLAATLLAVLGADLARAQVPEPTPRPDIPADEKDFEGLSSLSLGSGARALGMGGAFLARADDATAASWNPAGLSYLRRTEISLVGARSAFSKRRSGASDRLTGYAPDFAAATFPVESASGNVSGAFQVSFQRVFSFSGERTIERRDEGGALASVFETTSRGGFDVLAMGTGLKLRGNLRLGVTVNHWFAGYSQERSKEAGRRIQVQDIDYDLSARNYNLGLIWSPVESMNLGVIGKTAFTGNLTLTRNRINCFGDPCTEENRTQNQARDSTLRLHIPGAFGAGVSWRPRSPLTLSADYTVTFWSKGRIHNFFLIAAQLPGQAAPEPESYDSLPYPTLGDEKGQLDSQQLRLGGEYVVIRGRLKLPLRVGYFTDRQYFRSAGTLDAEGKDQGDGKAPTLHGLTGGIGVLVGPFLLDAAYVYERGTYVDAESRTQATTTTQRIFLSVIYRHGSN